MFNATFNNGPITSLNACVGNNGSPEQYEYAQGFSDASLLLCESTINDHHPVDLMIYPIAFNMRHCYELWLKLYISKLAFIRKETRIDLIDLNSAHDLNILWEYFKESSIKKDKRIQEHIDKLDNYVNDIAEIDPTGQTFRYPYNTESQKHLTNTPVINIEVLYNRFKEAKELLEDLELYLDDLAKEYVLGTYTNELNREQLFELAEFLPDYSKWTLDQFDIDRDNAKIKFGISSNELSKAINIIKSHYELSKYIGLSVPLFAANEINLKIFLNNWIRFHKSTDLILEAEASKKIFRVMNIEAIADIISIYEIVLLPGFSEQYKIVYNQNIKRLNLEQSNPQRNQSLIHHFLSKGSFPSRIEERLRFLNQKELLTSLKVIFDEARNVKISYPNTINLN